MTTDERTTGGPGEACRSLRADAERNRERIVGAAREAFAERGLDVSTNEIARRAGVGVATLFRRFPTRDPDPWRGFTGYIEGICRLQAADRAFADVLTMTFPTARQLAAERDQASRALAELLERAKASGRLRPDFVHQDVPLILMANAGVINATRDAAPDAWRRVVAYLLQAFETRAAGPLPVPPTPAQLYRAMRRLPSGRR